MAARQVMVWQIPGHPRSRIVCAAMMEGIAKAGDIPKLRNSQTYQRPEGDAAVFYGMAGRLAKALVEHPRKLRQPCVYIDLGYWGRRGKNRWDGYHKLVINGRHPTPYFQATRHSHDRFDAAGIQIEPWRRNPKGYILLAGMGPKAAAAEGFPPLAWEKSAVAELRRWTDRPIVYRPKPNWEKPPILPGTTMAAAGQSLEEAVAGAHCIVSHHSNAAVEALAMGLPSFTVEGAATPMSLTDFSKVEAPVYPDERRQWLADLAWTQFSVEEMASGLAWRHLKDEGLVP